MCAYVDVANEKKTNLNQFELVNSKGGNGAIFGVWDLKETTETHLTSKRREIYEK